MNGIVRTRAEADPHGPEPLLVLDQLEAWLSEEGIAEGEVSAERIGEGHSNLTYRLTVGSRSLVLRRGPRPPHPPTTHDMVREARIQRLLSQEGVPVPAIVGVHEGTAIMGVPFYVMEDLDGVVITDEVPLELATDAASIATAAIDALAALHQVDVSRGELAALGRPQGYVERQVRRFATMWPSVSERTFPLVDEMAAWLSAHVPPDGGRASVVHGDFRIGNLMFARSEPVRVQAILDWEMATLGDPLADLGYAVATYAAPGARATPLELTPVTRRPGFASRADLVDRYVAKTGADVSHLGWYQALALFKAAVFCEAIYTRWVRGERPGDTFGPQLASGVPLLLEEAAGLRDAG